MKEAYKPTDIVLPDQFLDRTRHRASTFFGDGCVGARLVLPPGLHDAPRRARGGGAQAGAVVHRGGTYVCMEGPQFSTRAESLLYRSWGVDVIGMTNADGGEALPRGRDRYASICLVTDYDCWHEEEGRSRVEAVLARPEGERRHREPRPRERGAPARPGAPERLRRRLAFAILTRPDA